MLIVKENVVYANSLFHVEVGRKQTCSIVYSHYIKYILVFDCKSGFNLKKQKQLSKHFQANLFITFTHKKH